jgi:hypothetical protein
VDSHDAGRVPGAPDLKEIDVSQPDDYAADQQPGTGADREAGAAWAVPLPPERPAYPMALEPPDPTLAGGADGPPGGAAAGAPRNPPPGGGRRLALVLTSAAAAVALAGAGGFGYLWWGTDRELAETRADLTAQVAELTETADAQTETIGQLERDLQRARDDFAAAERDLQGAHNMVELLQDEQSVIRRCMALNNEVLEAIFTENEAAFDAVIDEMEEVCDEAEQILSS